MDKSNSKVEFVMQALFGPVIPEVTGPAAHISYGRETPPMGEPRIHVCASGFLDDPQGPGSSVPPLPLAAIEGIPFFFGKAMVERHGRTLVVHADLIASAYFLLARCEEQLRREMRDKHGRFPGSESLPCRAGFAGRPVVDEYAGLFRRWLRDLGIACEEPPRKIRKILLTHDVDAPWLYPTWPAAMRLWGESIVRGQGLDAAPFLCRAGWRRDPYDWFDVILKQDRLLRDRLGADKVEMMYFLLARTGGAHEAGYDLRSRRTRRLIRKLQQHGARIGLHVSYAAGGDPALIAGERRRLEEACGSEVTASRHHFLRFREPEHIRQLEAAGIADDYSLGYADRAGFRLGTCRPFRAIDPEDGRLTRVTCHPLTAMDCTFDDPRYMALDHEQAKHRCGELLQQVARCHGEAVLLWHNTEFNPGNGNYHPELYSEIINMCGELA